MGKSVSGLITGTFLKNLNTRVEYILIYFCHLHYDHEIVAGFKLFLFTF